MKAAVYGDACVTYRRFDKGYSTNKSKVNSPYTGQKGLEEK
jgi:hypothetical protein